MKREDAKQRTIAELDEDVRRGQTEKVREMIAAGRDSVNIESDGLPPLMHAVLCMEPSLAMIEQLIGLGADVNIQESEQGYTALAFAARDQKRDVVRLLLDNGALVNARDGWGNTPLQRCLTIKRKDMQIIRWLLDAGADPALKNNYGVSPIDHVRTIGDSELLELFGA